MRRVNINGRTHALPFAELIRPLTPRELTDLCASIEADGVLNPLVTYDSPTHGRSVVDGMNRAQIAQSLGLEVPVATLGPITDAMAKSLALALNVYRRHLTSEEIAAALAGRIERERKAAANGESIRSIARREGVHPSQVHRDLKQSPHPVNGLPPRNPIEAARQSLARLEKTTAALQSSSWSEPFAYLARQHGLANLDDWLAKIRAVLSDLAARALSE